MRVTIKHIAQELGLSEAAVSLALNQRPGVSEQTRKAVFQTAHALGYEMGHLHGKQVGKGTILLVSYVRRIRTSTPFLSQLLGAAEDILRKTDYTLVSAQIDARGDVTAQLRKLTENVCAGILMLATEMDAQDFEPFRQLEVPIVLLDAYLPGIDVDFVTINNREGARRAVELLISEGRGCPGYLHSSAHLNNFDERTEGFAAGVRAAGYSPSTAQEIRLAPNIEDAEADLNQILDEGLKPAPSYFADNDQIAIGAMRALQAHGYRIPEDVSIVGFDNTELASYISPALTSLNVPLDYYSHLAVRLLLDLMDGAERYPIRIEVTPTLVRRASTR